MLADGAVAENAGAHLTAENENQQTGPCPTASGRRCETHERCGGGLAARKHALKRKCLFDLTAGE